MTAVAKARRHLANPIGPVTVETLVRRSHELTARRYADATVMACALLEEMEARGYLSEKGLQSRVTAKGAEE